MTTFVLLACIAGLLIVGLGHLSLPARDRLPLRQWRRDDVGRHARLGLRLLTDSGSRRADRLEQIAAEQRRRQRR